MGKITNEDSVKYTLKISHGAVSTSTVIDSKTTAVGALISTVDKYKIVVEGGGSCQCSGKADVFIRKGQPIPVEPEAKPEKASSKAQEASSKDKSSEKDSKAKSSARSSSNKATPVAFEEQGEWASKQGLTDQIRTQWNNGNLLQDDGWGPIHPALLEKSKSRFWDSPNSWGGSTPLPMWTELVRLVGVPDGPAIDAFTIALQKAHAELGDEAWRLFFYVHPVDDVQKDRRVLLLDHAMVSPNGISIALPLLKRLFLIMLGFKSSGKIELAQKLRLGLALLIYRVAELDGAVRFVQFANLVNRPEMGVFPWEWLATRWSSFLGLCGGRDTNAGLLVQWHDAASGTIAYDHLIQHERLVSVTGLLPVAKDMLIAATKYNMNPGPMLQWFIQDPVLERHSREGRLSWDFALQVLLLRNGSTQVKSLLDNPIFSSNILPHCQKKERAKETLDVIGKNAPSTGNFDSAVAALRAALNWTDADIEAARKLKPQRENSNASLSFDHKTSIFGREFTAALRQKNFPPFSPDPNIKLEGNEYNRYVLKNWTIPVHPLATLLAEAEQLLAQLKSPTTTTDNNEDPYTVVEKLETTLVKYCEYWGPRPVYVTSKMTKLIDDAIPLVLQQRAVRHFGAEAVKMAQTGIVPEPAITINPESLPLTSERLPGVSDVVRVQMTKCLQSLLDAQRGRLDATKDARHWFRQVMSSKENKPDALRAMLGAVQREFARLTGLVDVAPARRAMESFDSFRENSLLAEGPKYEEKVCNRLLFKLETAKYKSQIVLWARTHDETLISIEQFTDGDLLQKKLVTKRLRELIVTLRGWVRERLFDLELTKSRDSRLVAAESETETEPDKDVAAYDGFGPVKIKDLVAHFSRRREPFDSMILKHGKLQHEIVSIVDGLHALTRQYSRWTSLGQPLQTWLEQCVVLADAYLAAFRAGQTRPEVGPVPPFPSEAAADSVRAAEEAKRKVREQELDAKKAQLRAEQEARAKALQEKVDAAKARIAQKEEEEKKKKKEAKEEVDDLDLDLGGLDLGDDDDDKKKKKKSPAQEKDKTKKKKKKTVVELTDEDLDLDLDLGDSSSGKKKIELTDSDLELDF